MLLLSFSAFVSVNDSASVRAIGIVTVNGTVAVSLFCVSMLSFSAFVSVNYSASVVLSLLLALYLSVFPMCNGMVGMLSNTRLISIVYTN